MKRFLIPALVMVVLVLSACGSAPKETPTTPATGGTQPTTPAAQPTGGTVEVPANQVYTEYRVDRDSADAKYRGKTLVVTGVVQEKPEDFPGETKITVSDGTGTEGWWVHVYFASGDKPALDALTKQQPIKVQGKYERMESGFLGRTSYIILREGKILQ